jgi:exonuclease III
MRLVAWNVERLRSRLADLPRVARELGNPDVLCQYDLVHNEESAPANARHVATHVVVRLLREGLPSRSVDRMTIMDTVA